MLQETLIKKKQNVALTATYGISKCVIIIIQSRKEQIHIGSGFICKCKKCGKKQEFYLGIGFLFPKIYAETYKAMQQSKYSELGRNFLADHPDGSINCDNVVLYYAKYHILKNGKDLTMYLPKDGHAEEHHEEGWSIAMGFNGADYVTPWDLKEDYVEYAKFPHPCPKCQDKMKVLNGEAFSRILRTGELKCDRCGGKLISDGRLDWD